MAKDKSPSSFAAKMRAYAAYIPKQVAEIKKQAMMEIVLTIVPATPVLSGEARSNYFVTIGKPDNSSTRKSFDRNGDISVREARRVVSDLKPGQSLFLTNNTPYIKELNAGSSKQAPAGFQEAAILAAQMLVARQVIRFGGRK